MDAGDKVSIAGTEYAAASDATSIEVSNDGSTVKLTSGSVDLAPGESILLPDSTLIENTGTSTIQVGSDGAISILEKGAVSIDSKVYANVYEGTPLKLQVDEAADTVSLTSGIVVLSPSAVVLAIGNTFANSSTDPTLQVFVMMVPPDSKAVFMRVPENTTATVNGMAFTGLEDGGAMLIVSPTGDFLLWVGNTTLAPGASVGISSGQTVTNPAGSGQTLEVRADTPENGMTTVHVPAGASVVVAGQTYTAPDDASIDVVIGEDGTVTVTVNRAPAENATGTLPNTGDTTGGVWVFILLACLALACVVVSKNESNDRIN